MHDAAAQIEVGNWSPDRAAVGVWPVGKCLVRRERALAQGPVASGAKSTLEVKWSIGKLEQQARLVKAGHGIDNRFPDSPPVRDAELIPGVKGSAGWHGRL